MRIFLAVSFAICLLASACSTPHPTLSPANPPWVNARIAQFQKAPLGNPAQSIWKYEYKGQIVYYFPPQCCDQFSQVYDSGGSLLCAPDGGLTGSGDGKCPDFFKSAKNRIMIWQDTRSK